MNKPSSGKPKGKSRIRNPEKTREKLLQATIDLLAEKGPDAVSLKDAARLAKVSRGVAYQHFENRDHLVFEAKQWISDRLLESARNIGPALEERDVRSVMEESVLNVARLVLNNREAAQLLLADALAGKALDRDHPLYERVVRDLEDLRSRGDARRDFDIEILSLIMLGSVATLIMLSYLPHAGDPEALAQRYALEWTTLLREGIIGGPPRGKRGKAPAVAPRKVRSGARSKTASGRSSA